MPMSTRCQANKADGDRCTKGEWRNEGLCWMHLACEKIYGNLELFRCDGRTSEGRCWNYIRSDEPTAEHLCAPHRRQQERLMKIDGRRDSERAQLRAV